MITAPITPSRLGVVGTAVLAAALAGGAALAKGPSEPRGMRKPDFVARLDASQTIVPSTSRATGEARFWLDRNRNELHYRITLDGLDLTGFQTCSFPIPGCDPNAAGDDVTNVHIHVAPPGSDGPHALNVYLGPSDDDGDLLIHPRRGLLAGIWDDGDANPDLPSNLASIGLSDALDDLCAGNLYVAVHTTGFPAGAIRGQIEPSGRVCDKPAKGLRGP